MDKSSLNQLDMIVRQGDLDSDLLGNPNLAGNANGDALPMVGDFNVAGSVQLPMMIGQEPYTSFEDAIEFAYNAEPRLTVVLLLDTSTSMAGDAIHELNQGLGIFLDEVREDPLTRKRLDLQVIEFGPVRIMNSFASVDDIDLPKLSACGATPMGEAINVALDELRERLAQFDENGVSKYKPFVILMTDGEPTDQWTEAARRVNEGVARGDFGFFAIGVSNANLGILSQITPHTPKLLRGLSFREFFTWLSRSVKVVSRSTIGTQIALPPTDGWAVF